MTFSIVGYCPDTGAFGIAITSSSVAVASRCAWTKAGSGVIATQNLTNPHLGPLGLDLLSRGLSETIVRDMLVASDAGRDHRQLMVLGPSGRCAHFTGASALDIHAHASDLNCGAAGNLLSDKSIPERMVFAFCKGADRPFAQRLLDGLHAGLAAGGEIRPLQSAGLLVADNSGWTSIDLRVDLHEAPLDELQRLWDVYRPLHVGYVDRVLAPERYFVPPQE